MLKPSPTPVTTHLVYVFGFYLAITAFVTGVTKDVRANHGRAQFLFLFLCLRSGHSDGHGLPHGRDQVVGDSLQA